MTAERKTPETDKMYDMVSDREAPNYNMVGHLPSKWSYEAILDLTDFARRLERQRDAAVDDRVEAQKLGMQAMDEAAALRHDIERAVQRNSDLLAEVETVAVANCPSLCDEFCNAYQVHAALVRLEAELAAIKAAQPEYMCPNCVTPWKCNGPHIPEHTIKAAQEGK